MDIEAHQGISEQEILRIAQRVSWGSALEDIIQLYAEEGQSKQAAILVYRAAETFLNKQADSNQAIRDRQRRATTRRDIPAARRV